MFGIIIEERKILEIKSKFIENTMLMLRPSFVKNKKKRSKFIFHVLYLVKALYQHMLLLFYYKI